MIDNYICPLCNNKLKEATVDVQEEHDCLQEFHCTHCMLPVEWLLSKVVIGFKNKQLDYYYIYHQKQY